MAIVNEHYLKLQAGYLFPEIARRVDEFRTRQPGKADRVISCGIGDVTEPIPEAARQAMHEAIDDQGRRETFHGYGPPTGYDFLKQQIAEHDLALPDPHSRYNEIFISEGSKIDCGAVLDILGQGNRIAITDPVYPVYVDSNVMAGNTGPIGDDGHFEGIVYLPCTKDTGFLPQVPDEPVDVIYLCYPNNPTGAMISRESLRQWVDYALEHDALILYDVAYKDFIQHIDQPRSIYEVDGAERCAIEFHSFSKNGGFTGIRCGYTICPRAVTARTSSGERIELNRLWTRRWATKSNGVSYPVQRGAAALYSPEGQQQTAGLINHYMTNAALLRDGCQALGLEVYGGHHAPYIWVACPKGLSSWEMFDLMLEQIQVVTTPGIGFGSCGEGYFRISAFNSRENIEEVVGRMSELSLQDTGVNQQVASSGS